MRTRHADAGGRWRYAPLVLVLCLGAASALAQVPDATIQRIVALNVQATEDIVLRNNRQIDDQTWKLRKTAINAEIHTLTEQIRKFPEDERRRALS
ncbi:MAG: hypothetical protein ACREMY_18920, partial [bacterium]